MSLSKLQLQTEAKVVMKVKMFVRHSLEDLEKEVNEWIERQEIRIGHVTQSQCEKQGKFVFVISVFYETLTSS